MKRNFLSHFALALFFALASLLPTNAQTAFLITSKDTIYVTVTKNLPVTSTIFIVDKSSKYIQLSYSLLQSKYDANWDLSNCDNSTCYADLNKGTNMDTFGSSKNDDTSYFYIDASFTSGNPDTAIVQYSIYEPSNLAQKETITWVFYANSTTGIESAPKPVAISVFPNPAGNMIHLGTNNTEAYKNLEIISMTGARVYTQGIVNANGEVNVSSFTPGLYIVQFSDNNGNLFQGRFEKMN